MSDPTIRLCEECGVAVAVDGYNQRTNEDLKVCLFCVSDLLKKSLPKVEEP